MVFLHGLGAVIVLVGLALFIFNQVKPVHDHEDDSVVNVWKINLQGPPALVLILVGVLVFVFPYTPWFGAPEDPSPPSTLPPEVVVSTTVAEPGETTTLVPEIPLPLAPDSFFIEFDDTCGEDTLFWTQPEIENVFGWWISIEAYDVETDELFSSFEIDTGADTLTLGNVSALCEFDFTTDVSLLYWIWIYPYNEVGFSEEPLFVEYLDE